jgi:hypothetical protein
MSAALQFPMQWPRQANRPGGAETGAATGTVNISACAAAFQPHLNPSLLATAVHHIQRRLPQPELVREQVLEPAADLVTDPVEEQEVNEESDAEPINTWAFYRKHTESLLRRYLYASMQVCRSPNLLGESVGRGWVSSRRVRSFDDALIFVLDVERCISRLEMVDRQLITRRVLQEYTHQETAAILGLSLRTLNFRFPMALDHLTEILVETDLLVLPD